MMRRRSLGTYKSENGEDLQTTVSTNRMTEKVHNRKTLLLADFYIDFLGSLVPGLFTVVLSAAVLALSANVLCHSICVWTMAADTNIKPSEILPLSAQITNWKDIGFGPYGNTGLLLVVAYILGSIFYRQDPKIPDHRSARLIWRNIKSREDRERLAVQPTSEQEEDVSTYDAQFPYFFLREYLEGRGLIHLAKWIPWSGRDKNTWKCRTKMFINVLKIRLQFLVPERCINIIRNEAHVRMATSVWYGTHWLIITAILSLVMIAIAITIVHNELTNHSVLSIIGFNVFVLAIAFLIKFKIEKFIHYLRVREIVYVLETADFATRNGFQLHSEDFVK